MRMINVSGGICHYFFGQGVFTVQPCYQKMTVAKNGSEIFTSQHNMVVVIMAAHHGLFEDHEIVFWNGHGGNHSATPCQVVRKKMKSLACLT